MVLENVKEMWTETPRLADGKKGRPVNKDRFISKMYAIPHPILDNRPDQVPAQTRILLLNLIASKICGIV